MSFSHGRPPFQAVRSKTLLKIAGAVLCTTLIARVAYYASTEGFSITRIEAPLSFSGDLSVPTPSDQQLTTLTSIVRQRFRYLKKGSQAYAFVSDDGRYVLKLFKLHHMQNANWLKSIPSFGILKKYRDSLFERRGYRINLTLNSYKIAAEQLPEECALIYAQILPSSAYTLPVTIQDAIGRTYSIDLARHGYAIQRKSDLVLPCFEQWIEGDEIEKGKAAIDSLVALIAQRSLKGIQDTDPDLHKNAGLVGGRAIFIDIGSFHECPTVRLPSEMKQDMNKVFLHFSQWLTLRSPELANHLAQRLDVPEQVQWVAPEGS